MKEKILIVRLCPNTLYAVIEGEGGLGKSKQISNSEEFYLMYEPKEDELWKAELIDNKFKLIEKHENGI